VYLTSALDGCEGSVSSSSLFIPVGNVPVSIREEGGRVPEASGSSVKETISRPALSLEVTPPAIPRR
jgi:hypothetical protein